MAKRAAPIDFNALADECNEEPFPNARDLLARRGVTNADTLPDKDMWAAFAKTYGGILYKTMRTAVQEFGVPLEVFDTRNMTAKAGFKYVDRLRTAKETAEAGAESAGTIDTPDTASGAAATVAATDTPHKAADHKRPKRGA